MRSSTHPEARRPPTRHFEGGRLPACCCPVVDWQCFCMRTVEGGSHELTNWAHVADYLPTSLVVQAVAMVDWTWAAQAILALQQFLCCINGPLPSFDWRTLGSILQAGVVPYVLALNGASREEGGERTGSRGRALWVRHFVAPCTPLQREPMRADEGCTGHCGRVRSFTRSGVEGGHGHAA